MLCSGNYDGSDERVGGGYRTTQEYDIQFDKRNLLKT